MMFKDHSNRNWLVTGIVIGISLFMVLFAILPFVQISTFSKALVIIIALVITGYPVVRHIINHYNKKSSFEQRRGRKLR